MVETSSYWTCEEPTAELQRRRDRCAGTCLRENVQHEVYRVHPQRSFWQLCGVRASSVLPRRHISIKLPAANNTSDVGSGTAPADPPPALSKLISACKSALFTLPSPLMSPMANSCALLRPLAVW